VRHCRIPLNATEQRQRHTAITQLEAETVECIKALQATVLSDLTNLRAQLQDQIDHGASYCDERWIATSEAQGRIIAMSEPLRRGFWGRLKWLFTGA
jgi:hypothetical protein